MFLLIHSIQLGKYFMEGLFKTVSSLSRKVPSETVKKDKFPFLGGKVPKHFQRHTLHMADKPVTVMGGREDKNLAPRLILGAGNLFCCLTDSLEAYDAQSHVKHRHRRTVTNHCFFYLL